MNADVTTTARDRARLIREGLAAVWDLLTAAYAAEDWKTLGYPSWEAYCIGEFQGRIPRLAKSERGGVVQELADHGMPIKAIAAATGLARNTVRADLRPEREGGQIDPPATPSMSRDEWAATITADIHRSRLAMNRGLDEIRRALPSLRRVRDAQPERADEMNRLIGLVEHPDGAHVTDDEHFEAVLHMAANYGGEMDQDIFLDYLRRNRKH